LCNEKRPLVILVKQKLKYKISFFLFFSFSYFLITFEFFGAGWNCTSVCAYVEAPISLIYSPIKKGERKFLPFKFVFKVLYHPLLPGVRGDAKFYGYPPWGLSHYPFWQGQKSYSTGPFPEWYLSTFNSWQSILDKLSTTDSSASLIICASCIVILSWKYLILSAIIPTLT